MKKILFIMLLVPLLSVFTSAAHAAKPVSSCNTIQSGQINQSYGGAVGLGYNQWGYNYQAHLFNGSFCDSYQNAAWCQPYKNINLSMKWNDAWLSNQDCDSDNLLDRPLSYRGSGAWLTNHASGTYQGSHYNWDVAGNWTIVVNGIYNHDLTFTMTSLPDGTFTGTGGYPSGGNYLVDEVVANGQITGDQISFTTTYYQNGQPAGYVWHAIGTIDASGNMSGTGDAGVVDWHTTSGSASKVYEVCPVADFVKIVAAPSDATLVDGNWVSANGVTIGPAIWGDFAIIQEVSDDPCNEYGALNFSSPLRKGLGNW